MTLHNIALMNMDQNPTSGFEKLQFLLQQVPCPPGKHTAFYGGSCSNCLSLSLLPQLQQRRLPICSCCTSNMTTMIWQRMCWLRTLTSPSNVSPPTSTISLMPKSPNRHHPRRSHQFNISEASSHVYIPESHIVLGLHFGTLV